MSFFSEAPQTHPRFFADELADIHDALVLGLRDYARKEWVSLGACGPERRHRLGPLTAALAKEALGAGNVLGVSTPAVFHSSQHSRDDAAALARNLGIRYETLPIADVVAAAESTLAPLFTDAPPP